ncbi:MAG: hypothetical protein NZ899_12145 [Thermoguttaceae bacterium]|nr:hypothetical protein [Thermoguttaceae bacterium]MDW8079583.1 hypothetical protein [Thermoguttaceae bacterium]
MARVLLTLTWGSLLAAGLPTLVWGQEGPPTEEGVGLTTPQPAEEQPSALTPPASGQSPEKLPYEPTTNYEERTIRGWRVLVHKSLLEQHREVGQEGLELLDFQLYQITRAVPEPALEKLRQIPIWVEYNNPRVVCACYHPSRRWLRANGFNPEKAGSVEIGNIRRFLQWTHDQPWMVLHELAHGYHHRFLGGYGNPEIVRTWQEAVDAGLYDSVLHCRGHHEPAYAKKNAEEYFAELSEAWFGANDFYPFVRAEVARHDPKGAELMNKMWGTRYRIRGGAPPAGEKEPAVPAPALEQQEKAQEKTN